MKRGIARFAIGLVVAVLVSGCTVNEDVVPVATSEAWATKIAATWTAISGITPLIATSTDRPTETSAATATALPGTAAPTATGTSRPTATSVPSTASPTPSLASTSSRTPTATPDPTATEPPAPPTATPVPPATPSGALFEDGFEGGQAGGSLIHWTATELQHGSGVATAEDDTSVFYEGSHSARFQVTDGTQGGAAYVSQSITWPSGNRLWYSCYFRLDDYSNAAVGGIYIMEAFIKDGAWRDRADIEVVDSGKIFGMAPGQTLDSSTFLLRMAYRGRDGGRDGHRQPVMIQAPARNVWHHVQMLVDRRGAAPRYAWWLNGGFIWQDSDTSLGTDTAAPTEFHAGITNVDWEPRNRARVWVDNCAVAEHGPEPPG